MKNLYHLFITRYKLRVKLPRFCFAKSPLQNLKGIIHSFLPSAFCFSAFCFLLSAFLLFCFLPFAALAQGPIGDVIINKESCTITPPPSIPPPTSVNDIKWDIFDHLGYDQAYTEPISIDKNGYATPNHIVFNDSAVAFYGYGIEPYLNYIYADIYDLNKFSFTMTPRLMNFHSFSETGFFFNGDMTFTDGYIYYTGYALVLQCANKSGMQEFDENAPNYASLRVYYIDNEQMQGLNIPGIWWHDERFTPGNTTTTRTLLSTVRTNIENFNSDPYRVEIDIDPNTRAFKLYVDGDLKVSVSAAEVIGGASGPKHFGFYNGSYEHNCYRLTDIYFEKPTLDAEPNDPVTVNAEVRFLELGTSMEIRTPETNSCLTGTLYNIVQPKIINYNGKVYKLINNSRNLSINQDMELIYRSNSARNITILYYYESMDQAPPEKTARVDGTEWTKGTDTDPIPVYEGSEIEYNITVYAPPTGVPMLMQGTNGSYSSQGWWGSTGLNKSYIRTITFIDLIDVPDWYDQLFVTQTWNGTSIWRSWNATEQNLLYNPERDEKPVYAWTTTISAGVYNLYVGGLGGVWLSSAPTDNYQFYLFNNLQSIDLTGLHTDLAVNMAFMFANCGVASVPLILDMSNFNTSNVTNMASMFYQSHFTSLDLSSFNTSNVTNMNSMFTRQGSNPPLTSLNLSNFNTSNVTNMGQMFSGCTTPSLNLSNFNTENVTNMSSMFAGCNSDLDLSSFNTSNVTNMTSMFNARNTPLDLSNFNTENVISMRGMFNNCKLSSLDLSNFNTTNVTDMYGMFYQCSELTSLNLSSFNNENVTNMYQMFYQCSKLTSLNLSSFNTSNVTNMYQMFYQCTGLTSLNLSSFNTENVQNMHQMFYQCSGLTTSSLNISSFNTQNVTDMFRMFEGCTGLTSTPAQPFQVNHFNVSNVTNASGIFRGCNHISFTYLDLSWWELGTSGDIDISSFVQNSRVNELHIENADLSNITTSGNWSTSFAVTPTVLNIYTGNTNTYDWLLGNPPYSPMKVRAADVVQLVSPWPPLVGQKPQPADWTTNIVDWHSNIVPWEPNLIDWKLAYTGSWDAPAPPPAGYVEIRDTIPTGLTIDPTSITGTESPDPIEDEITWKIDGQYIIWTMPNDMPPITVSVTATVNSGLTNLSILENRATVVGQTTMQTDTTYHQFIDACHVTEQYFLYDEGVTTTKIASDLVTYIPQPASPYIVKGNPLEALAYVFCGYDIGDGNGYQPATSISQVTTAVSSFCNVTIQLYYKKIYIHIHYVTDGNLYLKTVSEMLSPRNDYYLPQNSFNSFVVGATTYYYYDYAKNGDESVRNVVYSSVSAPAVGLQPLFPDGSVPTFEYDTDPYYYPINDNMNITLFVTNKPAVKVNFVEYNNPQNILHNPEYYFLEMPFDPAVLLRSEGDALDADIDLTAEMEKLYKYANQYKINGGAEQTGFPGEQSDPCEITLYFRTAYVVTEKFHSNGDAHEAKELMPDIFSTYFGGETYEGNPPLEISDGDSVWVYIGYKVGNDENPLIEYDSGNPEFPSVDNLNEDLTIIYVYEKQSKTTDITIIERWREYNNTGNVLDPDESIVLNNGDPYPDHVKNFAGWQYVGWMLDGDETLHTGNPSDELTSVTSPHTITYCYEPIYLCQGSTIEVDKHDETVCGLGMVTIKGSFTNADGIKVETLDSNGKKPRVTVDTNTNTFTVTYNTTIANVGNVVTIIITATDSGTPCPAASETILITVKPKPTVRGKGECIEEGVK